MALVRKAGSNSKSSSRNEPRRRTSNPSTHCARALIALFAFAGTAFAHDDPNLFFPEDDFVVKWYQADSNPPVQNWEIEITPLNGAYRFYADAQVFPDDSCWGVNVPYDEPALVRIRAVSGNTTSSWSQVTSVPEPGFAVGGAAAVGTLVALASRSRRRSIRGPSRVSRR